MDFGGFQALRQDFNLHYPAADQNQNALSSLRGRGIIHLSREFVSIRVRSAQLKNYLDRMMSTYTSGLILAYLRFGTLRSP
jgi:hypothetical protein